MGDADRQLQLEELDVLESIYGCNCMRSVGGDYCYEILFSHVRIVLHLPDDYPSTSPPILELHDSTFPDLSTEALGQELYAMFNPGNVVLFDWMQAIRDKCDLMTSRETNVEDDARETEHRDDGHKEVDPPSSEHQQQSSATSSTELEAAMEIVAPRIITGEAFIEKKSTFQAHVAPISSPLEAKAMVEVLLQSSNKIRSATHNMMAYRVEIKDGIFAQDFDDDGEAAAGKRLMHLLQVADCRNVAVVVSRWFGGTLLGPSRFTYINNCARELLETTGFIEVRDSSNNRGGKKKGGTSHK